MKLYNAELFWIVSQSNTLDAANTPTNRCVSDYVASNKYPTTVNTWWSRGSPHTQ